MTKEEFFQLTEELGYSHEDVLDSLDCIELCVLVEDESELDDELPDSVLNELQKAETLDEFWEIVKEYIG